LHKKTLVLSGTLTIVIVEGGGHVLCGKAIGGVADDEGRFADGAVADQHALDLLLAVFETLVAGRRVVQQGGRQALVAEGRHRSNEATSRNNYCVRRAQLSVCPVSGRPLCRAADDCR